MYLIYWDYRQIYGQAFAPLLDIIDVKKYLEIVSAKSFFYAVYIVEYDIVLDNLLFGFKKETQFKL